MFEGVDTIERLQESPNKTIADVAYVLIGRYFSDGKVSLHLSSLVVLARLID